MDVLEQLESDDENIRRDAVRALAASSRPDVVSLLLSALEAERAETVRLAIVDALGNLRDLGATGLLEKLLWADISGNLRYEVERALKQIEQSGIARASAAYVPDAEIETLELPPESHYPPIEILIQDGIEAACELRRDLAADYLRLAVQIDPYNEQAWLWLSLVIDNDEDQLICLENVLWVNPENSFAARMFQRMNGRDEPDSRFYTDGGTIKRDSGLYIKRAADTALYEACIVGELAYVLTSRQMGKSSLMVQTAERLKAEGIRTAIVDMNGIGTSLDVERFYTTVLDKILRDLGLKRSIKLAPWWKAKEREILSPPQRFDQFIRDELLSAVQESIVVFIDEVDSLRSLKSNFKVDDFFAVIRSIYNARASDPDCSRINFVLLGAALPGDLIEDKNLTLFNIGRNIALGDFNPLEATELAGGLGLSPEHTRRALEWVLEWTGGHPFLSQKLCKVLAEQPQMARTKRGVASLVEKLFTRADAHDNNILYVEREIMAHSDATNLLRLYYRIYSGRVVREADEKLELVEFLKLAGLIQARHGQLIVRNKIYETCFNRDWIEDKLISRSLLRLDELETLLREQEAERGKQLPIRTLFRADSSTLPQSQTRPLIRLRDLKAKESEPPTPTQTDESPPITTEPSTLLDWFGEEGDPLQWLHTLQHEPESSGPDDLLVPMEATSPQGQNTEIDLPSESQPPPLEVSITGHFQEFYDWMSGLSETDYEPWMGRILETIRDFRYPIDEALFKTPDDLFPEESGNGADAPLEGETALAAPEDNQDSLPEIETPVYEAPPVLVEIKDIPPTYENFDWLETITPEIWEEAQQLETAPPAVEQDAGSAQTELPMRRGKTPPRQIDTHIVRPEFPRRQTARRHKPAKPKPPPEPILPAEPEPWMESIAEAVGDVSYPLTGDSDLLAESFTEAVFDDQLDEVEANPVSEVEAFYLPEFDLKFQVVDNELVVLTPETEVDQDELDDVEISISYRARLLDWLVEHRLTLLAITGITALILAVGNAAFRWAKLEISGVLLCGAALCSALAIYLRLSAYRNARALDARLRAIEANSSSRYSLYTDVEAIDADLPRSQNLLNLLDNRLIKWRIGKIWQHSLISANLKVSITEYLGLHILAIGGLFGLIFALTGGSWLLSALAGVAGFFLPGTYVNYMEYKRLTLFNRQLPQVLSLWVNSLRSGYSVLQAIEAIAREVSEPIATEFRRVVQEVQLGIPLEDAFNHLLERVPDEDLDLIITVINIQREVGGNLAEILEVSNRTIRERVKLKADAAIHARPRYWIFFAIAVMLVGAQTAIFPVYFNSILTSISGQVAILIAYGMVTFALVASARANYVIRSQFSEYFENQLGYFSAGLLLVIIVATLGAPGAPLLWLLFMLFVIIRNKVGMALTGVVFAGLVLLFHNQPALMVIPGTSDKNIMLDGLEFIAFVILAGCTIMFFTVLAIRRLVRSVALLRRRLERDPMMERLWHYAPEQPVTNDLSTIEFREPFEARTLDKLDRVGKRLIPPQWLERIEDDLSLSWIGQWVRPGLFYLLRGLGAISSSALVITLFAFVLPVPAFSAVIYTAIAFAAGYFIPSAIIQLQARARRALMIRALPDVFDLLILCVEAGSGFDSSMGKVYEKWDHDLASAFGRVLREVQLGKLRRDALRDMGTRLGIPELSGFIAAVIQSDQLGVSMARTLQTQAEEQRIRRQQLMAKQTKRYDLLLDYCSLFVFMPGIMLWLIAPVIARLFP